MNKDTGGVSIARRDFNQKIPEDMKWRHTSGITSPMENDIEPCLPLIQAPVLMIWGDSDRIPDVGGVMVLDEILKHFKTVIMKDMVHLPMMEYPRKTASSFTSDLQGKKWESI